MLLCCLLLWWQHSNAASGQGKALKARHIITMGSQRSGDPREKIDSSSKPFRGDTFWLSRMFPSGCAARKGLVGEVALNEGLRCLPPHKLAMLIYGDPVATHPRYGVSPIGALWVGFPSQPSLEETLAGKTRWDSGNERLKN